MNSARASCGATKERHRGMQRSWRLAAGGFVVITGILSTVLITLDRQATIRAMQERATATVHMLVAHVDAAADAAARVVRAATPLALQAVGDGDPRLVQESLAHLVTGDTLISAIRIIDSTGLVVADSRRYPPPQSSVAGRAFFEAHKNGRPAHVIDVDDTTAAPDAQGQEFSYSEAIREGDTLKALIAVSFYRSDFETLYREVANWPDARVALYSDTGHQLAAFESGPPVSPGYLSNLRKTFATAPSGTGFVDDDGALRLIAWDRSRVVPDVTATSSQPLASLLDGWRLRAFLIASLTVLADLMFLALAAYALRTQRLRQRAEVTALAAREMHHRFKNALQLVSSLVRLRSNRYGNEEVQSVVGEVTRDLSAVAEAFTAMDNAPMVEGFDVNRIIASICDQLRASRDAGLRFTPAAQPLMVDGDVATRLSIIVSELVAHAMSTGREGIHVSCESTGEALLIDVTDGEAGPKQTANGIKGLGLKAVNAIVLGMGATISTRPGTAMRPSIIRVEVPHRALTGETEAY